MTTIFLPPPNTPLRPPRQRHTQKQAALDALEHGLAFEDDTDDTPDAESIQFADANCAFDVRMTEGALNLVQPVATAIMDL